MDLLIPNYFEQQTILSTSLAVSNTESEISHIGINAYILKSVHDNIFHLLVLKYDKKFIVTRKFVFS